MVMLPNGGLQQLPGPGAGLGQIKFEMENRFDVYLHDTPSKNLFSRDNRRISHGCIRVQNPRELAALLMQQPIDTINQAIATGGTTRQQSAGARAGIRGLPDRVCRYRRYVAISPRRIQPRRRDLAAPVSGAAAGGGTRAAGPTSGLTFKCIAGGNGRLADCARRQRPCSIARRCTDPRSPRRQVCRGQNHGDKILRF